MENERIAIQTVNRKVEEREKKANEVSLNDAKREEYVRKRNKEAGGKPSSKSWRKREMDRDGQEGKTNLANKMRRFPQRKQRQD